MPDARELVINTGPLLALVAAFDDLGILHLLYDRVIVPLEVSQEILVDNASRYGGKEFEAASDLEKKSSAVQVSAFLKNSLDPGEAGVIQTALDDKIETVCIDEPVGRRVARLHGLRVTGSVGILLRAKREGHLPRVTDAIERMRSKGIRLSDTLVKSVLEQAGEE